MLIKKLPSFRTLQFARTISIVAAFVTLIPSESGLLDAVDPRNNGTVTPGERYWQWLGIIFVLSLTTCLVSIHLRNKYYRTRVIKICFEQLDDTTNRLYAIFENNVFRGSKVHWAEYLSPHEWHALRTGTPIALRQPPVAAI